MHARCPFYGFHGAPLMEKLLSQGGNQCGLIVESYAPCRMEVQGLEVDFELCEFKGSGRALQFARFERVEFVREENTPHEKPDQNEP